jgi:hypothetical protein
LPGIIVRNVSWNQPSKEKSSRTNGGLQRVPDVSVIPEVFIPQIPIDRFLVASEASFPLRDIRLHDNHHISQSFCQVILVNENREVVVQRKYEDRDVFCCVLRIIVVLVVSLKKYFEIPSEFSWLSVFSTVKWYCSCFESRKMQDSVENSPSTLNLGNTAERKEFSSPFANPELSSLIDILGKMSFYDSWSYSFKAKLNS